MRHSKVETLRVGDFVLAVAAIVVTEDLLIKVTVKMERFDGNISPAKVALQQAPEVFESVGMNLPVNIPLCVVNNLMGVLGSPGGHDPLKKLYSAGKRGFARRI